MADSNNVKFSATIFKIYTTAYRRNKFRPRLVFGIAVYFGRFAVKYAAK